MPAHAEGTDTAEQAADDRVGRPGRHAAVKLLLWGLQALAAGAGGYWGFDAGLQISSGMGLAALMGLCMALCGALLASGLGRWLPPSGRSQREA